MDSIEKSYCASEIAQYTHYPEFVKANMKKGIPSKVSRAYRIGDSRLRIVLLQHGILARQRLSGAKGMIRRPSRNAIAIHAIGVPSVPIRSTAAPTRKFTPAPTNRLGGAPQFEIHSAACGRNQSSDSAGRALSAFSDQHSASEPRP